MHARHDSFIDRAENSGGFRAHQAQSYPDQKCTQWALMFVEHWSKLDAPRPQDVTCITIENPSEGDSGAVPEGVPCWDPVVRWREMARVTWRREEHNHRLEGRAALPAASPCLASQ